MQSPPMPASDVHESSARAATQRPSFAAASVWSKVGDQVQAGSVVASPPEAEGIHAPPTQSNPLAHDESSEHVTQLELLPEVDGALQADTSSRTKTMRRNIRTAP